MTQLQNKIAYISVFSAAAISLFVVESFIPRPAPGIRLGLSNIFILLTLISFGLTEALLVGMLKSVVGNLVIGQFLSPSFILSIGGTIVSIIIMSIALRPGRLFSLLGVSILGAESHIITQILLVSILFLGKTAYVYLLPPYILISLFSGSFIGITTYLIYSKIERKIDFAKTS